MVPRHAQQAFRRLWSYLARGLVAAGLPRAITREKILREGMDGGIVYQYGSAERFQLKEPIHVGELPRGVRDKLGPQSVPKPFVFDCPDVELVGPSALPITAYGRYLLEPLLGSSHRLVNAIVETIVNESVPARTKLVSPAERVDVPLFTLVGPWCTDFFHWFADYLPRLEALEHYEEKTGRTPEVLVPAEPPSWLTESLDLLDVPRSRRRHWSGLRTHVDRLVVGTVPRHTETSTDSGGYVHSPRALRSLSRRLRTAAGAESDHGSRLYVSREGATDRRVVNEPEILDTIDAFGFERILHEQLPLRDQIVAFSSADAIMGPHGAGLLNVIYADDPTLVELFGAYQNPCFFAIAGGFGIDYATTQCAPEGDNIRVEPNTAQELLERTIAE